MKKSNTLPPELDAQLKKRIKAAVKSGKLDVSATHNCQFNFKYVPSLVYKTFGQSSEKNSAEEEKKITTNKNKRSRNEKTSDVSSSIAVATHLRELWLSKNSITILTRELYSLPKLQVLCLSDNNLSAVPSAIGDIGTLKRLILNGNKITTVPADIMRCEKLEELRLDNNRLSEFPLCLTELRNLVRLGLSRNKIGPTIPAQVRKLRRLIELDLDYNNLTTLPSTLSFLSRSLQHLGLSYNRFAAVPDCVKELSKLDVLRIEGNRVHTTTNEETAMEETHYNIPMRHDGIPELRTGETVIGEDGNSTHVVQKLPGYLEESFVYNRMNANWLRNDLGDEVNEVNLLKKRALRKPPRIKSEESKPKGLVMSAAEADVSVRNLMKGKISSFHHNK
jgi:Leucine-rich repeat (LRR) protein